MSRRFVPSGQRRAAATGSRIASGKTRRIGIWDVEVYAGYLPRLLESWNKAQDTFSFEMIQASVPRSLSKGGAATLKWADEVPKVKKSGFNHFYENNIVADKIIPIAEDARKKFNLDLIVLLTSPMIAFTWHDKVYFNYFSLSEQQVIVVSAYEVRDFSKVARRSFEVGLGCMILPQIIISMVPELNFHQEDRGCLFDFNGSRSTLSNTIARARIEKSCLDQIPEPFKSAAESMARVLREYNAKTGT